MLVVVLMLMLLMVVVVLVLVASSWWLGAAFFGFLVVSGLVWFGAFARFLFLLLMLVLIWTGPLLVLFSNTLLPRVHTTTQT